MIDLSEKQGTGITKVLREIHKNGSKEPEYEMDEERVYFAATLPIREGFEYLEGEGACNNLDIEGTKVQRVKLESLNYAIRKYNKPTKDKILFVYENTDESQIISASEVQRILGCPESTAKDLIKKMRAVDLLFFNRALNCLVVVELKKGKFKTSYLGQQSGYLSVLDEFEKKPHENPAIGIILCKDMNKAFVDFVIRDFSKPMGVATYRIAEDVSDEIKNALPDLEELKKLLEDDEKIDDGGK